MNNLILGTAFNYTSSQIEVFVKSLRKFYQGSVVLVVNELKSDFCEFLEKHNIRAHVYSMDMSNVRASQIFHIRHACYREILEHSFFDVKRVFLSDVRDVLFQASPFSHISDTDLEFFLEPKAIKDCEFNSKKIRKLYGQKFLNQIGDNLIICAGTTIGTRSGIINYLDTMILELERLREQNGFFADDQAVHNYLIYTNKFKNYKMYKTGYGPVATLHHLREGIFDQEGQVININGSIVPIVHQWDRLSKEQQLILYQKALT